MSLQYTIDVLRLQKQRLEQLLHTANHSDERQFYRKCLDEVSKDIENISKIDENTYNFDE